MNNFFSIITLRPIRWEHVVTHLRDNRDDIHGSSELPMLRRRIECDGGTASAEQLEQLIDMYPKELAFSLFLCTTRFPVHSRTLMNKIFQAIEDYSEEQMTYCIQKFQGDENKEKNADTVLGEAMTLIFSVFDEDYVPTPESGNLRALCLIKHRYPRSILYIDGHEFTPLHGVCCALNMDIFRFFINWHLEQDPTGRGGLYSTNDSGISPMDTLIENQQETVPLLKWLRSRQLLKSNDVEMELFVHMSAHSSQPEIIQFFIDLYPSGVMSKDDVNLPITMHLGWRDRASNSFSDEDYAITKLLVTKGIEYGGIDTIGGLFHPVPDEEETCTLDALLKKVGKANHETLWGMVDEWIEEVTGGDYTLAPVVHAALLNKEHMSEELFEYVMSRYATNESNEDGVNPLMYAVKLGAKWDGCVCHLLNKNLEELNTSESETMLPILPFAASRKNPDISMLYEFARRSPWMFEN